MKQLRTRILLYALALSAGAAYAASPYRVGMVRGDSMSPSMRNGEFYLLERASYPEGDGAAVQRGDVIVFRRGEQTMVKRVLAVAGDTFYVMARQGDVGADTLVRHYELPGLRRLQARGCGALRLVRRQVPPGYCYAVGDNLAGSDDSRAFGFVPLDDVLGRTVGPAASEYALYPRRGGTLVGPMQTPAVAAPGDQD
jgi:signal peptidase I